MQKLLRGVRFRVASSDGIARLSTGASKIVESEVMDLKLPNLTFHEMIWSREKEWAGKTALVRSSCEIKIIIFDIFLQIDAVRGDEHTFSEARSLCKSFGHGLLSLGAQVNDVVAVVLPNMPEYAVVMLGASEAALRVTTLNPTYTPSKLYTTNPIGLVILGSYKTPNTIKVMDLGDI